MFSVFVDDFDAMYRKEHSSAAVAAVLPETLPEKYISSFKRLI